eukprot:361779-Ditylum_brightwellii.AAC.1
MEHHNTQKWQRLKIHHFLHVDCYHHVPSTALHAMAVLIPCFMPSSHPNSVPSLIHSSKLSSHPSLMPSLIISLLLSSEASPMPSSVHSSAHLSQA